MRLLKGFALATSASAAISAGIAAPVAAQSGSAEPTQNGAAEEPVPASPADDDEIVVTATRQDQRLGKVPISVAAFSQESLDSQGVRNVGDLARITPGLTFTTDSFGAGTSTNISIRGVSSQAGAATTGIYIDDVAIQIRSNAQTAFGTAYPRIFDLERVEVLRGPQGTLFGAGAQGGVVRFITPSPDLVDTEVYSRAEIAMTDGGDASYEGGIAVGTPLVTDRIGLRLSAYYRHDGGWVDRMPFNVATPNSTEIHEDANAANALALRGALRFQLSDAVSITPAVFYQQTRSNDTSTLWGTLSDVEDGVFANGYSLRQHAKDSFVLPSLNVTADLGSVELASVTSWFDRKGTSVSDYTNLNTNFIFETPYPFIPGWQAPGFSTARQKVFSQEVRLSSTDSEAPVRWTVGAYYSRAHQIETIRIEDTFTANIIPLAAIFGIGLTDGRYIFTSGNNTVDEQLAVFAQADASLTDSLTATLGLRYSQTTFDFQRDLGGPLNYSGSGPETTSTFGVQEAKPFTPKVGLSYEVDDRNMVYASAAKGFRVGGVNPPLFASCAIQNPPSTFGPDTTWSFEAGSKNRLFGGALRTEASVFYIKWQNIQQFVLAGCAGNGFRDNIGSARSQGFDLQFSLNATDNLQLSGSLGYVDARFTQTVIVGGKTYARAGDTLGGSPWQLAGNVDYTIPADRLGEVYLHADARYNSHNDGVLAAYDDPNASGYDPSLQFDPAVTEVNVRAGLRTGGVDASIFVNNLFNSTPLLGKSHDVETSPLFYYRTPRPRTIGLTVGYRY
ncbi:MAG: TonB-dependent receptor [Alteraurantiacibacter sp.]